MKGAEIIQFRNFYRIDFTNHHGDGTYSSPNGEKEVYDSKWTHSADKIPLLPSERSGHTNKKPKQPSLVWALARSFGGTFLKAGVFKFLQDNMNFVGPQLLK